MQVRAALPGDFSEVLDLLERPHFSLMPSSPARLRARYQKHFTSLNFSADSALFVGEQDNVITAFACLVLDQVDSITKDRQAVIFDLVCDGEPAVFLRGIESVDADLRAEYLLASIPYRLTASEQVMEEAGYHVCLNKVAKLCDPTGAFGLRALRRFPVRRAEVSDRPFILLVSNLSAQFLLPPGREECREGVEAGYMDIYSELNIVDDPELVVLVAEDPVTHQPTGYTMIRFISRGLGVARKRTFGYIYDVAIHPDFRGTLTFAALQGAVEQYLSQQGIPAVIGEVSEANPRALKASIQLLRYTIESRKYSKRLPDVKQLLTH